MPWECCLSRPRSKLSVEPTAQDEEIAAILCAILAHARAGDHLQARAAAWKLAMRYQDLDSDDIRAVVAGRKHV